MLRINENFVVTSESKEDLIIGYGGENLSRTFSIHGEVEQDAVYYLETKGKNGLLFWPLHVDGDGLSLPITSALLTDAGFYMSQISKHTFNNVILKSNIFLLEVKTSVNALDVAEPVEPDVFEEQINQMAGYLQQAQELVDGAELDLSEERTIRANADNALDERVTYLEEHGGGGTSAVTSVNGKAGRVVLTGEDISLNGEDSSETIDEFASGVSTRLGSVEAKESETEEKVSDLESKSDSAASDINTLKDFKTSAEASISELDGRLNGKQDALTEEQKQAIADMHNDAVTSVNGQTGDVTIPEATPYDDSEIRGQVTQLNRELTDLDAVKMQYAILNFDGTAFTLGGQTLTFAQIKDLCLNKKDFVYALYENRLYIPQYVSGSNIFFDASYIQSDIPKMHRISINSSNQVSQYSFELAKLTDIPAAAGTDVQINGESITVDGVANIPAVKSDGKYGLIKFSGTDSPFVITDDGRFSLAQNRSNYINNRYQWFAHGCPITAKNLDYAVKQAMCDGIGTAWTATEQAAAQERIGILSSEGVTF